MTEWSDGTDIFWLLWSLGEFSQEKSWEKTLIFLTTPVAFLPGEKLGEKLGENRFR